SRACRAAPWRCSASRRPIGSNCTPPKSPTPSTPPRSRMPPTCLPRRRTRTASATAIRAGSPATIPSASTAGPSATRTSSIPSTAGSYAYLDAMLETSAQEAFAVDMRYDPTVTNAVVAPDLNKRIGFTPDEINALVDHDYAHMTKNDVALKEWWDTELKG